MLAAHEGTPFALLLDLDDEGEYGTRLRVEAVTPAGDEPEKFGDSALARLGLSARKGVLLYGPPGTGKTLLVRYLAGHTKFILGAHQMETLGEAVGTARLLQPAMIVIEDVDLIAADRDGPWQHSPSLLKHLRNEIGRPWRGGPDARVLFVR